MLQLFDYNTKKTMENDAPWITIILDKTIKLFFAII